MATERAVLAGGCFWGMQDLIRRKPGVLKTRVGYTGDNAHPNATYRNHGDHAEGIEILFDPAVISYRDILEFFFQIHDPTTRNRQGNDLGRQYRSTVFHADDAQREIATRYIRQLDEAKVFAAPIATTLEPLVAFHDAETYHQDYAARNPAQPYIAAVAAPKVAKLRKQFAQMLKDRSRTS